VILAEIREMRRNAFFPIIQTQPKALSLVYAEKFPERDTPKKQFCPPSNLELWAVLGWRSL